MLEPFNLTLIESYKRDGKPVPEKAQLEKEAQEELVCDMLSRMLADQHAYDKLMELKQENLNAFQKLGEAIKKFLDKIAKFIGIYDTQVTDFQMAASVETFGEEAFRQLQDLYIKAFVQADANFQAAQAQKNTTVDGGVKEQARQEGYGGIREVLAKKGLDELSKKCGNKFPLSTGFDQAMKADKTPLTMHTVKANQVTYSKNLSIYKAARNAFITAYGVKTSVHIQQMGIDAMLYADMAKESISKAVGKPNEQSTLDAIPRIREILSDSVLMGIERIAHTGNKGTALYGYRLYNLYWYDDGQKKSPNCLVCTVVQSTDSAEGYVFHNIENVTVEQDLPGNKTGMPPSLNSNTYTVAQLYKTVKKIDRGNGGLKYTDAEKDKYLFAYTERNDGVKYYDRDSNGPALAKAAAEHFGRTYGWKETGYLLTDGSKLDFSGRHEGASGGYRTVDHRQILDIYPEDTDLDGNGAMVDFMRQGNIRIMPEGDGINLQVQPTKAQEQALDDFISRARGEVTLDIDDADGNTIVSVEYPRGTRASKVLQDIRNYFENGTEPVASTIAQFRYSDRDYSYEALTSKPDMVVTTVGGNVPNNRADVVHQAKKNAAKVGKFNPKDGSVSVHVDDIDADVVVGTAGLKHSLDRRFNVNAPVTLQAGLILQNSIQINELTPQHPNAQSSYVLIGAAKTKDGQLYIVRSVVNRFSQELSSMDVLYAFNGKTEPDLGKKRKPGGRQSPMARS